MTSKPLSRYPLLAAPVMVGLAFGAAFVVAQVPVADRLWVLVATCVALGAATPYLFMGKPIQLALPSFRFKVLLLATWTAANSAFMFYSVKLGSVMGQNSVSLASAKDDVPYLRTHFRSNERLILKSPEPSEDMGVLLTTLLQTNKQLEAQLESTKTQLTASQERIRVLETREKLWKISEGAATRRNVPTIAGARPENAALRPLEMRELVAPSELSNPNIGASIPVGTGSASSQASAATP